MNAAITALGPRLSSAAVERLADPALTAAGPSLPGHVVEYFGDKIFRPRLHADFDAVALNPQPLPPKDGGHTAGIARLIDDFCGTGPRIPHFPPPRPFGLDAMHAAFVR